MHSRSKNRSFGINDISAAYDKYSSALKGYVMKRTGSEEDSEDIVQNIFFNLIRSDLEANPIVSIASWLYSAARNQIIDRGRKKKESRIPSETGSDDETKFIDRLLPTADTPENEYMRTLLWEEINSALEELPEEQRTIFELTELNGFSYKEISATTGITVNTLISRKRYAVLHLRERLSELYEGIDSL